MSKKLKDIFASLNPEQRSEFLAAMPDFIAGLSPEERKALDIAPAPADPPPADPPKPKSLWEQLDEWSKSVTG